MTLTSPTTDELRDQREEPSDQGTTMPRTPIENPPARLPVSNPPTASALAAVAFGATAFAVASLVLATIALVSAYRNDTPMVGSAGMMSAGNGAANRVDVGLADFAVTPSVLQLSESGGTLVITNNGPQAHNLSVPELGLQTRDLAVGQTVELNVPATVAGTYRVICTIAGHEQSGMVATLRIGEPPTSTAGTPSPDQSAAGHSMTAEEMDRMMIESAGRFPEATEGLGGQPLTPTVRGDRTKRFEITASIVDWQVDADTTVKAWTYNGTVPAPTIQVDVGDTVEVVLTNQLPESTALHFHGVRVPNAMDGVPPYTQDLVEPGDTFTYRFTALEPAVGMYHSHNNAQLQVPNGLAGAFLIGEMPIPASLKDKGFERVDQRVNMVLNDGGTIGLSLNGKSFPATQPYTLKVGETMLVNYFNEGLMVHPMHLHQPKGWIIAKDGVPLEEPIPGDTFSVAPGERYTVLYQAEDPGVWAWHCHILNHAEGPTGMFGMVTALIVEE
jgi:manganese oxidase